MAETQAKPLVYVSDTLEGIALPADVGYPARELDSLTADEWGDLIVALGVLRTAIEDAENHATAEWFQRYGLEE